MGTTFTILFLILLCAADPDRLHGQDQNGANIEDTLRQIIEENRALREKLEQQEKLIRELEKRVQGVEAKPAVPPPEAPEPTPPKPEGLGITVPGLPRLNLRGFADVTYRAGIDFEGGETLPNTFTLGQVDLLTTSQLTEKANVLGEFVFSYDSENDFSATIERIYLQYSFNDLLNFRIGRTHTPFGYWNETFHHGAWLQVTALRPELMRFHDGGSVLPLHSVGLEAFGRQPMGPVGLSYYLGVANGRGPVYSETQNIQDANANKAVYGVITLEPDAIPGLRFGGNGY